MSTTYEGAETWTEARRPVRWGAVLTCLAVTVIEGYNLIVYGSLVPLLVADPSMRITRETAGFAGSAVYVGMFFGGTAAGILGDRLGRKRVLVASTIVFVLGALIAGVSVSALTLGFARFVLGLGVGGALVVAVAIARSNALASSAAVAVTVTLAGVPLGGAIAALLAMPVLPAFGWRVMFFIGAVLAVVVLIPLVATRLESPAAAEAEHGRERRGRFGDLFRQRRAPLAVLIALVAIPNMFTWYGVNTWLVATMAAMHFALNDALLFSFTLTGGAIVGSFLTMRWADKWGVAKVGTVMAALTLLGLVALGLGGSNGTEFSLFCVALVGAGGHSTATMYSAAATNIFPESIRATALAWSDAISRVGSIGGTSLGGMVLSSSLGAPGVFALYGTAAGIACAAMLAVAVTWARRSKAGLTWPAPAHASANPKQEKPHDRP